MRDLLTQAYSQVFEYQINAVSIVIQKWYSRFHNKTTRFPSQATISLVLNQIVLM